MQTTIDLITSTHRRIVEWIAQHPGAALWIALALLILITVIR